MDWLKTLTAGAIVVSIATGCSTTASQNAESGLPPDLPAGLTADRPAPASSPEEAIELGVQYLLKNQNEDGSWGSFESARPGEVYLGTVASHRGFQIASSSLCTLALLEPSRSDPNVLKAFERGLEYLLTQKPVGRATGGTFYDTWAHTYLIEALAAIYQDPRFDSRRADIANVVNREIQIMIDRQAAEGGWGYYDFGMSRPTPTGDMSTSFNTSAALLALHSAKEAGFDVPEDVIHDALSCVERLRLPSGAYVYGTYAQMHPGALYNYVEGSLGRAQPCNLALWKYNRDLLPSELEKGIENLREFHHFIEIGRGRPYPHEAWYYTAGYYFHFGHYYASRVLLELTPPARAEYSEWLANVMVRIQDPDGSWFDFPLYGFYKAYGTGYALLTLENCLGRLAVPDEDEEATAESAPLR